jgi:hypothetical protein
MDSNYNLFDNEEKQFEYFLNEASDKRGIDDPGLNQDDSYEKSAEDFDDSDDFHKYDDTDNSNVDQDDEIATSNDTMNEHSENDRPTFNRTYDKNASDEVDNAGKYDGNIGI